MSNAEAVMHERFTAVASATDDSDWGEVLLRAGVLEMRPRFRSRRAWAAMAGFSVIACGALVAMAIGFGFRTGDASSMPGPSHVDLQVPNGTIRWLIHHELRGQSLQQAHIAIGSTTGSHWQPVRFARVLTPNPASRDRIVVSLIGKHGRNICITVFHGKGNFGGCAIANLLHPYSEMTASGLYVAPAGAVILAGLASDRVTRMELFLPHGDHKPVPLRDNAFLVQVTAREYPANLVAYDKDGKIIGTNATARPPRLPR